MTQGTSYMHTSPGLCSSTCAEHRSRKPLGGANPSSTCQSAFLPQKGSVADGSIHWTLTRIPQTVLELISKIILYCMQGRFVFITMAIPSFL